MARYATPVVVGLDGLRHTPLEEGGQIKPSAIPVSSDSDNLIQVTPDGLTVDIHALDDHLHGNISNQTGNLIIRGADGGVFLDGNQVLSNGTAANLLTISPVDNKIQLVAETIKNAVNAMGIDGNVQVSGTDKILAYSPTGGLSATLKFAYNQGTGVLRILGNNDSVIQEVVIPSADTILESSALVNYAPNIGNGNFLHFRWRLFDGSVSDTYVDMGALVDIYFAGDGLKLDPVTRVFSLNVTGGGGVKYNNGQFSLDISENGGLKLDDGQLALKVDTDSGLRLENGKLALDFQTGDGLKKENGRLTLDLNTSGGLKMGNGALSVDPNWLETKVEQISTKPFADMPLFFLVDPAGVIETMTKSVIPGWVTTARLTNLQSDYSANGLSVEMSADFIANRRVTFPMNGDVDVSGFSGQAVTFKVLGLTTQTQISAILHME